MRHSLENVDISISESTFSRILDYMLSGCRTNLVDDAIQMPRPAGWAICFRVSIAPGKSHKKQRKMARKIADRMRSGCCGIPGIREDVSCIGMNIFTIESCPRKGMIEMFQSYKEE